jgi:transcriptional regulator with XRE-family HTH domain
MVQESLALRLRLLRARKGITLTEAEELTGVTRETLGALERGERHPYTPTLAKIARGYGVPVEDLVEEEELATTGKAEAPEAGRGGLIDIQELLKELDLGLRQRYRTARVALLDTAGSDYLRLGVQGNLQDAQNMSIPEVLVRAQDLGRERNRLIVLDFLRGRLFEDPRVAKDEIEQIREPYSQAIGELLSVVEKKAPTEEERKKVRTEFWDRVAELENELSADLAEAPRG